LKDIGFSLEWFNWSVGGRIFYNISQFPATKFLQNALFFVLFDKKIDLEKDVDCQKVHLIYQILYFFRTLNQ